MKARWFGRILILILACTTLSARDKLNDEEREWLQMVDPIITAKERKTFRKRMKTHEARRQFIRLFWAKRDPDLDDKENPFRKEYLARYDYVITHYETRQRPYQEFTRGSLFLLLGKPEIKRNFVDWSLLGPGFRNRFFEYPPELWVYKKPGYEYKRKTLKVQFIAVNSFGDYAAITDRISDFWLRDLKNKFIEHPDLEEAPINVVAEDDYQYLAAFAEKRKDRRPSKVRSRKKKKKDDGAEPAPVAVAATPVSDPTEEEIRELGKDPEQRKIETRDVSPGTIATTNSPGRTKAETVSMGDTVAVEELETPALPTSRAPEIDETELAVPTTTEPVAATADVRFRTDAGNTMAVTGRMGYFKSTSERCLVLGRVGFPLAKLQWDFQNGQHTAPFQVDYALINTKGETVAGDSISNSITVPSRRIIDDPSRLYSEEFAVIVSGDLYTLRIQLTDSNSGNVSYHEMTLEVPQAGTRNIRLSDLVLMDPDVNPEYARFSIKGTPYNLELTNTYAQGDRLYPVVEMLNLDNLDTVEYIEIQAVANGNTVQSWDLYTEEMTETNQRSVLLHPILDTRLLNPGTYKLRFEIELTNGELLLSEADFVLTDR